MNCKPGQKAIQIGAFHSNMLCNVGALYEILKPYPDRPHPAWLVLTLSWTTDFGIRHPPGELAVVADQWLRPLPDDPADENIDESTPITERTT